MRFLLDANVRFAVGKLLQSLGHDVRFLAGTPQHQLADGDVLAPAHMEQRIIVTNDKDFGQLIFQQQLQHRGVVLFRLSDESRKRVRGQVGIRDFSSRIPVSRPDPISM